MTDDNDIVQDNYDKIDYLLIAMIMGIMGAFFWAIRGTMGFGGTDGGALAGLGWGMLWLGFSQMGGNTKQRPYGHGAMAAAIIFGITFGGLTGYGVYTAWVRGMFFLDYPEGLRPVGAWTGYLALFICGIHWGGIAGAFMAWAAPEKPIKAIGWILRILSGVLGAWLAFVFVRANPHLFLPFYSEGVYQMEENPTAVRALGSIKNIAPHVGLYLGFLLFEIVRRDFRAVKLMLLMAIGFAVPFSIGGAWHNGHSTDLPLEWWKNWEMTIGLGGGLTFGLAFYLFNRPVNASVRGTTKVERILGLGLPFSLATWIVIRSTHEGFIKTHQLEHLYSTRPTVFYICLSACLLTFIVWIVHTLMIDKTKLQEPDHPVIPKRLPFLVLSIIVLSGFITSIPKEPRTSITILLILYVIYTISSASIFFVLRKRRKCTD